MTASSNTHKKTPFTLSSFGQSICSLYAPVLIDYVVEGANSKNGNHNCNMTDDDGFAYFLRIHSKCMPYHMIIWPTWSAHFQSILYNLNIWSSSKEYIKWMVADIKIHVLHSSNPQHFILRKSTPKKNQHRWIHNTRSSSSYRQNIYSRDDAKHIFSI